MRGASLGPRDGVVTLIFYRMNSDRSQEPWLNRLAAYMTNSEFTHVEMAIGDELSQSGLMCNVVRVFNDSVGVELTERTGVNPKFSYMTLACAPRAERMMLEFSKKQVGKPFSMLGMARSIMWPRNSTGTSWYCAELVAAVMKVGGLIDADFNPGSATPENLYQMFRHKCATAANPVVLHRLRMRNAAPIPTSIAAPTATPPHTFGSFALPPVQCTRSAPTSPLPIQARDEYRPLLRSYHDNGYTPYTTTYTHTDNESVNTAACIRDAVLRARVLECMPEVSMMGGLYDKV